LRVCRTQKHFLEGIKLADFCDLPVAWNRILQGLPVGIVQMSRDGEILGMNTPAEAILVALGGAPPTNFFQCLAADAPTLPRQAEDLELNQSLNQSPDQTQVILSLPLRDEQFEVRLMRFASGGYLAALSPGPGVGSLGGFAFAGGRDVEPRRAIEAQCDPLTKMQNRGGIRQAVQNALDRSAIEPDHRFTVFFLNCDRFMQINNALGYGAGDTLLRLVAERLRGTLRANGSGPQAERPKAELARIGADEFVVLLDQLGPDDDPQIVAQRVLDVLAKPYRIGEHQVRCAVSMGMVMVSKEVSQPLSRQGAQTSSPIPVLQTADTVLRDASIAMSAAKRAGGGRYAIFDPRMGEAAAWRGTMEADLRRGLANGELHVVYQPLVVVRGAAVRVLHGVEALVRWTHPARGPIPPLEFIGVAEEGGLIDELSDFVLNTACSQFVRWRHELGAAAPGLLAVNLSRAQLLRPGWIEVVRAALKEHQMAPEDLQLEVTESLAAQHEGVSSLLQELKSLGLSLALDDFGTGYSSLSSLHALPIDTVKIDRSFVSQSDSSSHHRALIEATVRVANSLGMTTVAEGVETQAQADVIASLGCDSAQGSWFSRPLRAEALAIWANEFGGAQVGSMGTVVVTKVTKVTAVTGVTGVTEVTEVATVTSVSSNRPELSPVSP
jgi:diguanylate cyclase (GGDEF)-like protein